MIYTLTLNPSIDKTIYIDEENKTFYSAGGKGINVSKTIKTMEEESIALGFIGGDNGKFIIDRLDELGIKHDFVKIKGNNRENLKYVDKNGKLIENNQKGPYVDDEEITKLFDKIKQIKENDILVLSGSVCLGVENDIYKKIIEQVKTKNVKTILDGDNELLKQGIEAKPHIIKPNTAELCRYFGIETTNNIEVLKECCKKIIKNGVNEVLLSMGEDGALYVDNNNCFKMKALDIEVKSTVGAGDAMAAALAISLQNKLNTQEKIKMAIALASGACLSEGTEPSNIEVINDLKSKVVINFC